MRFTVEYEKYGVSYYKTNRTAWEVRKLKKLYCVYSVRRTK